MQKDIKKDKIIHRINATFQYIHSSLFLYIWILISGYKFKILGAQIPKITLYYSITQNKFNISLLIEHLDGFHSFCYYKSWNENFQTWVSVNISDYFSELNIKSACFYIVLLLSVRVKNFFSGFIRCKKFQPIIHILLGYFSFSLLK